MPSVKTKYQPVTRASKGPFSAAALVGVNTAVIGWDVDPGYDRKKLLGFAIRRTTIDPATKDIVSSFYLSNYKRFECDTDAGEKVSSLDAPFQKFNWNDYTLDPKYSYRFEIFPMTGEPCKLKSKDPLVLDLRPSEPEQDNLGVYFNRGVTAAMVYLDRFKGVEPSKVADNAAYIWLSNGLRESLLNFIDSAASGNELHVAIYEFHDSGVAERLKAAKARGVKVDIVYHSPDLEQKTVKESNHIIDHASLRSVATPRTKTTISHNKFVVLIKGGKAKSLWTGTSNFSEAGFYLQTNMGMIVKNPATAASYEAYFQVIKGDPASARKKQGFTFAQDLVGQVIGASPQKGTPFGDKSGFMFSPVRSQHVVDAAIELIGEAKSAVLLSAPFALDKRIVEALGQNPQDILEYGLVNSTAKKKIEGLNRFYTLFFTPTKLETYMGRAWDAKAFGSHKIHAKTIVIDPWGPNPAVLLGSANFSEPSCTKNDENAILVRGNKRLAAIVATEFIRMWEHYKSRAFINQINNQTAGENKFLKEDGSWSDTAFRRHEKSYKFRDRLVFSGKV
jgi:hypothetical protein